MSSSPARAGSEGYQAWFSLGPTALLWLEETEGRLVRSAENPLNNINQKSQVKLNYPK